MLANAKMRSLLAENGLELRRPMRSDPNPSMALVFIDGCTLIREQLALSHVDAESFPDKTGYECFVNHIHVPAKTPSQLEGLLDQVQGLAHRLSTTAEDRDYRVILSIDDRQEATLRFHEIRVGEDWIDPKTLDDFVEEAILVLDVLAPMKA